MSHMSLKKRCRVIMDHFGLATFDPMTLRRYYLKHGVKYKRPDYRFWKSMAENKQLK